MQEGPGRQQVRRRPERKTRQGQSQSRVARPFEFQLNVPQLLGVTMSCARFGTCDIWDILPLKRLLVVYLKCSWATLYFNLLTLARESDT